MFWVAQPSKCTKCGHEGKYSQDVAPAGKLLEGSPICPICYDNMIRMHCGVMEQTN